MSQKFIKLSDGKQIPALAWGNGTGGLGKSGQTAVDTGVLALKTGILHIDTAQLYGTEAETNRAIESAGISRDKVWVTSKVSGGDGVKTNLDSIRKSVQSSLDKLVTIPDLLLIHNPYVPEKGLIGKFWTALEDLVLDGTLKGTSLGVSNFRPQDLEEVFKVARIQPVVNQLEYHPYVLSHLEPLLELQEKHSIVTESYGPLTPILRHPGGPLKPVLTKIAERLSKATGTEVDESQVLLLWTIQKGVVAVTSSKREENLKKIVAVYQLPDLEKSEVEEIDKVGKGVYYRHYTEHMKEDFPVPDLPDGK